MRMLRRDYSENQGITRSLKYNEFPIDVGGPYYLSYVREGKMYEFQFDDFKDREARTVVANCLTTKTNFKVIAFWVGKKSKGHFFALNNGWVAKKFKLDITTLVNSQ